MTKVIVGSDQEGVEGALVALRVCGTWNRIEGALLLVAQHLNLPGGMRRTSITDHLHGVGGSAATHGLADRLALRATFAPTVLVAHGEDTAGEEHFLWLESGAGVDPLRLARLLSASLRGEPLPGPDDESPVDPGRLAAALACLRGIPGGLPLPERLAPDPGARARWQRSRPLPPAVLRSLGDTSDAAASALLLGLAGLVHRYAGCLAHDEVVLAATRSPGWPGATRIVRLDVAANPGMADLRERAARAFVEAAAWEDVRYAALTDAERVTRGSVPTEVALVFHEPIVVSESVVLDPALSRLSGPPLPGVKLSLDVLGWGDEAHAALGFSPEHFDPETVDRMADLLAAILGRVSVADLRFAGFTSLPREERTRILEASRSVASPASNESGLLHRAFEEQAASRPEQAALVTAGGSFSFGSLEGRANRIARVLRDAGVGPGVAVGLLMEHGFDLVAGMLGVMKAGGACLPLDVVHPDERLRIIVSEARPQVVLGEPALAARTAAVVAGRGLSVLHPARFDEASDRALVCPASPTDTAIILYTSGSQGTPKGVMMSYGGRLAPQRWTEARYPLGPGERHLFKSPISFGTMVREIFWPLRTGATAVISRPGGHKDSAYLVDLIAREQVTVANFTPSMLSAFAAEDAVGRCRSLRHVFCTGEALPVDLQEQIAASLPWVELHTFYGSTEYPTCTAWDYRPSERRRLVTVGRRAEADVFLLGPDGEPVPQGAPGEAYVSGPALARGYLARPELTAERFLDHPFASAPGARLFRIGDVLREGSDGQLRYLGRLDFQVKIRGCRVEVDDVAAALRAHGAVKDAVVVAVGSAVHGPRLAGYYVPREGAGPSRSALFAHLRAALPEYMIPAALTALSAFPTTPNGKLDRRALPAPDWSRAPELGAIEAPEGPVEEALATIWCEVLGLPGVGRRDAFLRVGGHSLAAGRVLARVHARWDVRLSVDRLFDRPTIAELAEEIGVLRGAPPAEGPAEAAAIELPPLSAAVEEGLIDDEDVLALVRALEESGVGAPRGDTTVGPGPRRRALAEHLRTMKEPLPAAPLSPAQRRLWYHDRLHPDSAAYTLTWAHRLSGPLDRRALAGALSEIVRRHDALRMSFISVDGQPVQVTLPAPRFDLAFDDLEHLPPSQREAQAHRIADAEARRPFDLSAPPLLRSRLVRLHEGEHQLFVQLHHIAGDGWSRRVLQRELSALYPAHRAVRAPPPGPAPGAYARFAWARARELRGAATASALSWWEARLRGALTPVELPGERALGDGRVESSFEATGRVIRLIPPELTRRLFALARGADATLFMVLRAAFALLICRLTGLREFVIGSPVSGRDRLDDEEVVGCFVNMIALRTELAPCDTFRTLLERVRRDTLEAFRRSSLPFELLVEALRPERSAERHPLFDISLNVLGMEREPLALEGLAVEELELPESSARFELNLYVHELGDALELRAVYRARSFSATRMSVLVDQLTGLLDQVSADPDRALDACSLVTDATRPLLPDLAAPLPAPQLPTVIDRFLACAEQHPDATALRGPGVAVSYGALASATARLAAHLLSRALKPAQRIVILGSRSPGLVVAMLAVWRARGVVVLLDPELPPMRRRLILDRADAHAAIVVGVAPEEIEDALPVVASLSPRDGAHGAAPVPEPDVVRPALSDPAYVVFTSGSTGVPKGILGTHLGLAHMTSWAREAFFVGAADRVPMLGALSFDPVLRDVLLPLTSGGTSCVPPANIPIGSPEMLAWIESEGITLVHTIPTLLRAWQAEPPPGCSLAGLRWLLVAGEPLHADLVERWRRTFPRSGEIVNLYGPTETTMIKSAFVVPDPPCAGVQPAGRALPDTQIHVLGPDLRPCGLGELGEIYIRTPCRTLGYLGAPSEQMRAFVPNPALRDLDDLLYRTGDQGRYRPDGGLEVQGRADAQLKVRGVRIEPEEVEAVLERHPGVARAAVAAPRDRDGERALVAWIVPTGRPPPSADDLSRHVRAHLPAAMTPSSYVEATSLPSTPNGKLDRTALERTLADSPTLAASSTPPEGRVEEALAAIWRTVLAVDHIGRHDDFFASGGHSLLAIRMMSRVRRELGANLPLSVLFPEATIAVLARWIESGADASVWSPVVRLKAQGERPPLFCVHPAGGSVLVYQDLATRLSPHQPLYGIQGPDPLAPAPPSFARIEDMAAHYVDALLDACPEPPYLLAGHSFGGVVAYEMAQRLAAAGRDVALLALLDTGSPRQAGQHGADSLIHEFASLLEKHDLGEGSANATKEGELWEDLKQLALQHVARQQGFGAAAIHAPRRDRRWRRLKSGRDRLASILKFFQEYRLLPAANDVGGYAGLLQYMRAFRANFRAARRYVPRPSLVPLTYFRALEVVSEQASDPGTRTEGWSGLAARGIQIHGVRGNHLSFLAAPMVEHLASELQAAIDAALGPRRRGDAAGTIGAAPARPPAPAAEIP